VAADPIPEEVVTRAVSIEIISAFRTTVIANPLTMPKRLITNLMVRPRVYPEIDSIDIARR
jgi:hypothetical protein